jgi:hypothetical protein
VAYVGNQPARGQWRKLSDISSAFDGVITTFTTSVPPGTSQYFVTAGSASQLLISLGGVIQEPDVDYTVSTNSVTFTTPPTSGLSFFGVLCGDALNAGVPSDGSVTTSKLAGGLSVGLTGGSVSTPSLFFTGDDNTGVFSAGADQLNIATNGVERVEFGTSEVVFNDGGANYDFRIEGDTNTSLFFVDASAEAVGIGTSSPPRSLTNAGSVTLTTGTAPQYRLNGTAADGDDNDRALFGLATASAQFMSSAAIGDAVLRTTNGGNLLFGEGVTERLRIDSSGRLLVGTSTSLGAGDGQHSLLQIRGNESNLSTGAFISLSRGAASTATGQTLGQIIFTDSGGGIYSTILCESDGTPGVNDFPGRIVLATTADGASSPTERMRIQANGRNRCFGADEVHESYTGSAAGTSISIYTGGYNRSTINSGGTTSYYVWSNGNVQNSNNSYTGISDIKLKENIVDANSQWDDLKALQVRNYNFKEGQTHTQIGLVAQEAELVSPGLVSESPDRDAEGNDLGTVTKSVNYSVLYMKAVKALQEAMERIETLQGMVAVNNITIDEQQHQISALAARLTALESA